MAKGKKVLTTGEVARICNVAPRTVSKWFDSGQLKGYRIPGSRDRRIPAEALSRFMKQHNMPTHELGPNTTRVIVVESREDKAARHLANLVEKAGYDVQAVGNPFHVGVMLQRFDPHVLLIDITDPGIDAISLCKVVRRDESFRGIRIIAIAENADPSELATLIRQGFDDCVTQADDLTLIKCIEQNTAILS